MYWRHVAWIGLGSNLASPAGQLSDALAEMAVLPGLELLAVSRFYRTTPVGGPPDQPDYCNAAAAVATAHCPRRLLKALQAIETTHGRVRDVRWGPRTLDLDMLAYDAVQSADPDLTLPHPRAHERGFVLVPLAEIAPALELGRHGRTVDCLRHVASAEIALWDVAQ